MRSSQRWGENDRLGWSLKDGAGMTARLIDCATTKLDTRHSLLLNMIHQEVYFTCLCVQFLRSFSGDRGERTFDYITASTLEN